MALAYNNRGFLKYKAVDFDDAILDMKQALRLDPGFEPAQTGLLCAQKDRENKLKRGW